MNERNPGARDFVEIADWCLPRIAETFSLVYSYYKDAFWQFNTTHWGAINVLEFEDHIRRMEELRIQTRSFALVFNGPRDEYRSKNVGGSLEWRQKWPSIRFSPTEEAFKAETYSRLMSEQEEAAMWLAPRYNLGYNPEDTSFVLRSRTFAWRVYKRAIS